MGAILTTCSDCSMMDAALGNDPDHELTPSGFRRTRIGVEKLQQQREQALVAQLNESETECADLQADIHALEKHAIHCRQITRQAPKGSSEFLRATQAARDALGKAIVKKKELAEMQHYTAFVKSAIEKARKVVAAKRKKDTLNTAREFLSEIDITEHEREADQLEENISTVADTMHDLDGVQERTGQAFSSVALSDAAESVSFSANGKEYALALDDELFGALDILERGHEVAEPVPPRPREMAFLHAQVPEDEPRDPLSYATTGPQPTMRNAQQRRAAAAVGGSGKAVDVDEIFAGVL